MKTKKALRLEAIRKALQRFSAWFNPLGSAAAREVVAKAVYEEEEEAMKQCQQPSKRS